jgi:hypothetical protein
MDSARTFVLTRNDRVVGYFSLTMGSVLRAVAPAKLVRGLPADPVGMVLLARLAVDRREQASGSARCCLPRHCARPSTRATPRQQWQLGTPNADYGSGIGRSGRLAASVLDKEDRCE